MWNVRGKTLSSNSKKGQIVYILDFDDTQLKLKQYPNNSIVTAFHFFDNFKQLNIHFVEIAGRNVPHGPL